MSFWRYARSMVSKEFHPSTVSRSISRVIQVAKTQPAHNLLAAWMSVVAPTLLVSKVMELRWLILDEEKFQENISLLVNGPCGVRAEPTKVAEVTSQERNFKTKKY